MRAPRPTPVEPCEFSYFEGYCGLNELPQEVELEDLKPKPRTSAHGILRLLETVPVKVKNGAFEIVEGGPGVIPPNPSSTPESSETKSFLWALGSGSVVAFALWIVPPCAPKAPGGLYPPTAPSKPMQDVPDLGASPMGAEADAGILGVLTGLMTVSLVRTLGILGCRWRVRVLLSDVAFSARIFLTFSIRRVLVSGSKASVMFLERTGTAKREKMRLEIRCIPLGSTSSVLTCVSRFASDALLSGALDGTPNMFKPALTPAGLMAAASTLVSTLVYK